MKTRFGLTNKRMNQTMAFLLGLIVMSLLANGSVAAEVIRVPGDFPTIQQAVDAASSGDTIQVAPGVYGESVRITTGGITLLGTSAGGTQERAVLDGQFKLPVAIHVEGTAEEPIKDVVIRGFEVTRYHKGIFLTNAVGCWLQFNEIHQIENPEVTKTPEVFEYNGIHLRNSSHNTILGNDVHDTGHDGISLGSLPDLTDDGFNTVRANRIARTHPRVGHFGCGISIGTGNNLIAENEATECDYGILLAAPRTTGNHIVQNRLHNNHRPGIYAGFDPASGRDIGGNFIVQNNATGNGTLDIPPQGTFDLFDGGRPNNTWLGNQGRSNIGPADFSNVFFARMEAGLNMVSLPLNPVTPFTARSFAQETGATVVIQLDEKAQRFVGFTLDAPDDGFPIEGGKGYIVNLPADRVVAFVGAAWANQPPVEAAPPLSVGSSDSAWAFVVSGRFEEKATDGYFVTVRNTRTNAVARDVVRSGYFAAAFADLTRNRVVSVGDRLEVTLRDSTGEIAAEKIQVAVTPESLRQAFLPIALTKVGKPRQTLLLQNYPNPFNPETWMPYQLQEAAHVTIQIYDAKGGLVRTLDLGQRAAGFYQSRGHAASWDGRNDAGEPVASGVYFYQLRAGDFSATRRMLIVK